MALLRFRNAKRIGALRSIITRGTRRHRHAQYAQPYSADKWRLLMRSLVISKLFSGAIAGACLCASVAHAQGAPAPVTGFYLGAGLGGSSYKIDSGGLASAGFATSSKDESDWAWNLMAGYKITRNWAVELGYVDLGRFTASGRFAGVPSSISADVTGWNVSAVGTLPLNDMFSVYGKLGYFRSKADATATVAGSLGRGTSRQSDVTAGIGARYHLTRNVSLLAEANYYGLGDNDNAMGYFGGVRYDF
jgi:OOP family OmpA-OmpF porin